jgi:tyrosine-specific transport protein
MSLTMVKNEHASNTLGATLLVTGCCIGAGMIGLPVVSALAGFMPSFFAMLLCYLFTTGTGLLLLEATLWFDQKVSLLSIAQFALGKGGKIITCALFLFLFYCLFVAYIDAGGQLFANILGALFHINVSREAGILTFVAIAGGISCAGALLIDRLNRLFMIGLIVSYGVLISFGLSQVETERLLYVDTSAALATLPILLICFGYQNLVPSLTHYLRRNVKAIRSAILIGNFIPFVVYFVWNFVILGLLPSPNEAPLQQVVNENELVSGLLENAAHSTSVIVFVKAFSLFAILTSFIPNALSFIDFLKDGFKTASMPASLKRLLICGLVLIPPTVCSLLFPHLFLKALGLAGGFADVLLFGILPAVIVYIGRYVKKIEGPYTVPGGKILLACIVVLSLCFLLIRGH